jgi:hypothetical protein
MDKRALACVMLFGAVAEARGSDLNGYFDFIVPEVVGELRDKTYDLSRQVGDDWRFVGNTKVGKGLYTGGGFGIHVLVAWPKVLLVGGEASVTGGRITDAQLPFAATSTALHYSLAAQIGVQHAFSVAMIHAAAVIGFDGMRFDVAGPPQGESLVGGGGDAPPGYRLERFDMRAGLQLGVHVNVARLMALWADGEIDYDGQYRFRAGLAIGAPGTERF